MPLYRGSPLVSALRGTIDSIVFQGSPHGPILRRKVHPGRTASPDQLAHRARMSQALLSWRYADTPTLSAWRAYALTHPTADPLGRLRTPRAVDLFIRYYLELEHTDPDNPPFPPLLDPATPPAHINAVHLDDNALLVGNPEAPYTTQNVLLQARITRHGSTIHRRGCGRQITTPLFLNSARTINLSGLVTPRLGRSIADEALTLELRRTYGAAFLSPPTTTLLSAQAAPYTIDDFETGEPDNWTPHGTYWTVEEDLPKTGTYSFRGQISGAGITTAATHLTEPTICSLARGAALSYWWNASQFMQTPLLYFCRQDTLNYYYFSHAPRNRYLYLVRTVGGSTSTLASKLLDTLDHSTWYESRIHLGPGPPIRCSIYTAAGALLWSLNANDSTFDGGSIGFQTSNQAGQTGTLYIDDITLIPSELA